MRRRGITLAELIVTLCIMAILASLIYPLLARTRAQTQQARCAENMRQIHAAIVVYRQDWGAYPPRLREAACPLSGRQLLYHLEFASVDKQLCREAQAWAEEEWQGNCVVLRCPTHRRQEEGLTVLAITSDGRVGWSPWADKSKQQWMQEAFGR